MDTNELETYMEWDAEISKYYRRVVSKDFLPLRPAILTSHHQLGHQRQGQQPSVSGVHWRRLLPHRILRSSTARTVK